MATISLGSTPGAPGTYINESAGVAVNAAIASFSTTYMLVETEESVPVTQFPYNTPIPVTSLEDFKALVGSVPTSRIPLLSYKNVNKFFLNAQVGDLRVVRVGTPNQILEIEVLPSSSKTNSSGLPSDLEAGNIVYVQLTINGQRLVAGDGSTGYTANGEWLGVPVTIPVDYVDGDEANNRRIAKAISQAIANAIETNPSIRSSVYVRSYGLVNDLDTASNSENGYVVIAGSTFDSSVTVVPQAQSPGSAFVFSTAAYDISTANGQQANLERVPQDYIQCINTAFDGQRDQGYLIAPTAYAQFDSLGRAAVGAAAAELVSQAEYKWLALADNGPFYVTDINKYKDYVPHKPASNLEEGEQYLVDNAIYKWTGNSVTYPKLKYQKAVAGSSPKVAIQQSANYGISPQERVGTLDKASFTVWSPTGTNPYGRLRLDEANYWPVDLKIQKVTLSGADGTGNPFLNLEGELFIVAAPYNVAETGDYSLNVVFLAPTLTAAKTAYNYVVTQGGSKFVTALPPGAINIPSDSTIFSANVSYGSEAYDFQVTINGQTSDLLENVRNETFGINTQHLPGTLQDPTTVHNLGLFARTFNNPSLTTFGQGGVYRGTGDYANNVVFDCEGHNLVDGVKIFFTAPIVTTAGRNLVNGSTKKVQNPYYVKVIDDTRFTVASSLTNFSAGSYLAMPVGDSTATSTPVTAYSTLLIGGEGASAGELGEATVISAIRARKYGFDSSSIYNQSAPSSAPPSSAVDKNRGVSIQLSRSASVLGSGTTSAIGETPNAGWLPQLELLNPPTPATALAILYGNNGSIASVASEYVTRNSSGYATAINETNGLVPGSQGYWNVEGEALMFVPPVWIENNGQTSTLTWKWQVYNGTTWVDITAFNDKVGFIASQANLPVGTTFTSGTTKFRVSWSLTDGGTPITGTTTSTPVFLTQTVLGTKGYNLAGDTQTKALGDSNSWYVGKVLAYSAATLNVSSGTYTEASNKQTVVKDYSGNVIYPVGSDSIAQSIKTADFNTYQIGNSTNGSYISVETSYVLGTNPGTDPVIINTLTSNTAIGTLQAFAVNNWSATAPSPEAWDVAIAGIDVSFFGPQNFACIPTVDQDFSTESYFVPAFPAFVAGTYNATTNLVSGVVTNSYAQYAGLANSVDIPTSSALLKPLLGVALKVGTGGTLPSGAGGAVVTAGQYIVVTEVNDEYSWAIASTEADLQTYAVPLYGSSVKLSYKNEQTPASSLWRFDAVTSTEIIDGALRGVNSNGIPQAEFIEAGVDNVNRLHADSKAYFNPFGFIAFYGPYITDSSGQHSPLSPYVAGVAARRYRAEGFQFPPGGVKYQLADAIGTQIPVSSAQQNLLNPEGCNVARSLPGYPDSAVFIWAGRTRINPAVAEQRQFQFVNTRVIQNVVYGSLRNAFDNQILSIVDGFGLVYNQIVSIGNSVLGQLYSAGALFGNKASDAFEVICDERINSPANLEQGVINVKVFDVPVTTLERIQVDLIKVSVGQLKTELTNRGLG